ncbi:MAG TPA: endo alpha-1,4 polygalactosaminidase [bacterium]|jgi:cysteinyl-tRNA synthetase
MKNLSGIAMIALLAMGCKKDEFDNIDFRQEMVGFVAAIGDYARDSLGITGFGIFPQNGEGLGSDQSYVLAVDGIGCEDIYYGYDADDEPTPAAVTTEMESALEIFKNAGRLVMTVDYATTQANVDDAYQRSLDRQYVPYVTVRALDRIRDNLHAPDSSASHDVVSWNDIGHFVYILQYQSFGNADSFVAALANTYYDLAIIDYSFDGTDAERFTPQQVSQMKTKADGKRRKVIAYLSIGEAEDYRHYWQSGWEEGDPSFIYEENPDWPGNFKVTYWDPQWQAIIFGYVKKIVEGGFDGVYLDIIDAYEYFENN